MDILLNGEPCEAEFNIRTEPSISFEQFILDPPEGLKTITEIICKRDGIVVQRLVIAHTLGDDLPTILSSQPFVDAKFELRTSLPPALLIH